MRVGSGAHTYEWVDNWAKIPDTELAREGWAHHGIVATEAGEIIACHQGEAKIPVFDKDGNLLRSWDSGLVDAHGMSLSKEGDTEYLWIADPGFKPDPELAYGWTHKPGRAVKTTLEGETVMTVPEPTHDIYRDGNYRPTWVVVNEERHGGNGDIWVADGYGENYVHRFDKAGNYILGVNGEEGAGRYDTPHTLFFDTRKSEPELYVADRKNGRVQIYDGDGNFKRSFGPGITTSPTGFVVIGDLMVLIELRSSRVTILDSDDNLVTYLGENDSVSKVDGWPNVQNDKGESVRTDLLELGKFNSPHGIAADGDGNIYVAEWLIGGRITKLVKS